MLTTRGCGDNPAEFFEDVWNCEPQARHDAKRRISGRLDVRVSSDVKEFPAYRCSCLSSYVPWFFAPHAGGGDDKSKIFSLIARIFHVLLDVVSGCHGSRC